MVEEIFFINIDKVVEAHDDNNEIGHEDGDDMDYEDVNGKDLESADVDEIQHIRSTLIELGKSHSLRGGARNEL